MSIRRETSLLKRLVRGKGITAHVRREKKEVTEWAFAKKKKRVDSRKKSEKAANKGPLNSLPLKVEKNKRSAITIWSKGQ